MSGARSSLSNSSDPMTNRGGVDYSGSPKSRYNYVAFMATDCISSPVAARGVFFFLDLGRRRAQFRSGVRAGARRG